jgi:hypothetical protein
MEPSKNKSQLFLSAILLIVLAAITRFIPHPFNFTAVGAIALFSGANFKDKRYAFLFPFIILFLTDLFFGFHFSMLPVYACFTFTVWLGVLLSKNQSVLTIIGGSLLSSIIFFLITNLPFWYMDLRLYPATLQGTLESYTMALPFFRNQILGDLFYNAVLFGVYHLVFRKRGVFLTEKSR